MKCGSFIYETDSKKYKIIINFLSKSGFKYQGGTGTYFKNIFNIKKFDNST